VALAYKTRPYLPYMPFLPSPFARYEISNGKLRKFYTPFLFEFLSVEAGSWSLDGADVVPHKGLFGHTFDCGGLQLRTQNGSAELFRIPNRNAFRAAVEGKYPAAQQASKTDTATRKKNVVPDGVTLSQKILFLPTLPEMLGKPTVDDS